MQALDCLRSLPCLEVLALQGTVITDKGLETLKEVKELRHIELSATRVSDEGLSRLRLALPNCEIRPEKTESTGANDTKDAEPQAAPPSE